MHLRLVATPLVAVALLFNTLGCAKKEDAAPAATGSYKLDGVLRNCAVTSVVYPASSSQAADDRLDVILTTVPQPTSGQERVVLSFGKRPGQPAAAYQLAGFTYFDTAYSSVPYNNDVTTLQENNGSYSGTFSGTPATTTTGTTPARVLTAGLFANARP